jgi:hypothetical protein
MRKAAWVLPLLLLFGCSDPPLKEGKVVEREFDPAHTEHYIQTLWRTESYPDTECSTNYNGQTTCHMVIRTRSVPYYVPATRWVEDDWDLKLKACEPKKDGGEKCRTSWRDVSQNEYDQCEVGSYYKEDEGCTPR